MSKNKPLTVSLLVPCYNEQDVLPEFFMAVKNSVCDLDTFDWRFLIVNDGSTDKTLSIALEQLRLHKYWCSGQVVDLSRNFGKESALLAGLDLVEEDVCIIIDADLQDPPEIIPELISQWLSGYEMVVAVRRSRDRDSFGKRWMAMLFYSIFGFISKLDVKQNAGDFRLLDKKVVTAIRSCRESVRFSKGFFAWVGFRQSIVKFDRPARFAGKTKWNGWKLWNYALDGIFNYSTFPLRVWSYVGLIVTALAFILATKTVLMTVVFGNDQPGYASLFTAITFLGGVQLIGVGILGEYLGRVYLESKTRLPYVVRQIEKVRKG